MTNNVIILGAGASKAAGIPLLDVLVDEMWGCAIRGISFPRWSMGTRVLWSFRIFLNSPLCGFKNSLLTMC